MGLPVGSSILFIYKEKRKIYICLHNTNGVYYLSVKSCYIWQLNFDIRECKVVHSNRKITNSAKLIMTVLVWGLFVITWKYFYNARAFRSHQEIGFAGTIIIWVIVFSWACDIFKSFSIASSGVFDSIISQMICIGITDGLSFVAVCLLSRGWVTIIPGLICYCCQMIIISIAIILTRKVLLARIIPSNTVVLYGGNFNSDSVKLFCERLLEKYSHMFAINQVIDSGADSIYEVVEANEQVIMAGVPYEKRKDIAKYCIDTGRTFYFIPDIEELIFEKCTVKNLLDTPLKKYYFVDSRKGYLFSKRVIDIILASILMLVAVPFVLVAAIAIKVEDGGPVFFRQLRVTKDEKRFNIIKLRSMVVGAECNGVIPTSERDTRVTKVGAFIRKTRIDELPQLLNILKGDMSFVGPRPERVEHVDMYEAELPSFKYRHMVRGGLTGYAQVYGKYNTSAEDKLKLDLIYIMNQSIYLDFRLFLLTFRTIFQKESTQGFKNANVKNDNEGTA